MKKTEYGMRTSIRNLADRFLASVDGNEASGHTREQAIARAAGEARDLSWASASDEAGCIAAEVRGTQVELRVEGQFLHLVA